MQKKTFLEKVKSQPSKRYERSDGNKNINKRTDAQLQKQIQTKAKRTKKKKRRNPSSRQFVGIICGTWKKLILFMIFSF